MRWTCSLPSSRAAATTWAAVVAVASLAMPASAFAEGEPIDGELEKYWNVELAVPTLDSPLFKRAGAFEASLGFGVIPNDSYYLPLPLNVRLGFHLGESFTLEGAFSYLLTPNSDLLTFLESPPNNAPSLLDGVVRPPRMTMVAGVDLVYSPFHGKVGIFDKKLASFDAGLSLGAGVVIADVDQDVSNAPPPSQTLPAARWGVTMRFFLTNWLTVRADVRQFLYKPEKDLLFPVEMTLGVAFLTI